MGCSRQPRTRQLVGQTCEHVRVYADNGDLVLSPTDLTKHLECPHLTTLDLAVARGERPEPVHVDEAMELIFALGLDHERAYLEQLRRAGRTIAEIPADAGIDRQVELTYEAMRSGAEIIYQAAFLHGG